MDKQKEHDNGYDVGATWAREEATVRELDFLVQLSQGWWIRATLPLSLGQRIAWSEDFPEPEEDEENAGYMAWEYDPDPFIKGVIEGALDVYEEASSLL